MLVSINPNYKNKCIPYDANEEELRQFWSKFNSEFVNVQVSSVNFLRLIRFGLPHTTWHKHFRSAENFICGQHICLDFDTGDDNSRIDTILQNSEIKKYASIVHASPSHTEIYPKARVIFQLPNPIYDANKFLNLYESVVFHFEHNDKKCRDVCRFFFGAENSEYYYNPVLLSWDFCAKLYAKNEQRRLTEQQKYVTMLQNRSNAVANKTALEKYKNRKMQILHNAPDGEKHITLLKLATLFGGHIALGLFDENEIIVELYQTITSKRLKSNAAAMNTIRHGISYGKTKPFPPSFNDMEELESLL